jgi:Tfp pilus assembly protein PilX
MQKLWRSEGGYGLVLTFLVSILVAIVGISLITMNSNSVKLSQHERDDQSLYYIAEAGVNIEKAEILKNTKTAYNQAKTYYNGLSAENQAKTSFDNIFTGYLKGFYPSNNYGNEYTFDKQFNSTPASKTDVTITKANTYTFQIHSSASFNESPQNSRNVEQVITVNLQPEIDHVTAPGGGLPNLGSGYTVQTKGNITLAGGAKIGGNVANENGIISLDGGASITGTVGTSPDNFKYPSWMGNLHDKVTNPVGYPGLSALPSYPYDTMRDMSKLTPPPNKEVSSGSNKTNVINNGAFQATNWMTNNYSYTVPERVNFTKFEVSQNNTIKLNVGDTDKHIYVKDLNVIQGNIEVIGTGKLFIYVENSINIKGSLNKNGDSNQVMVHYSGTKEASFSNETQISGSLYVDKADLTFSGGTGFKGNIYSGGKTVSFLGGTNSAGQHIIAPNANAALKNGATLKGALLANTLTMDGGTSINYAESAIDPGTSSKEYYGDSASYIKESEMTEKP